MHSSTFSGSFLPSDVEFLFRIIDPRVVASTAGLVDQARFAESLPDEPEPDAIVRQLFERSLATQAPRIAESVSVIAAALAREMPAVTLVSLARAGIPAGVLIKRYLDQFFPATPTAHYGIGFLRGIGLDIHAMDTVRRTNDPASIVYVDGWTGKGTTINELRASSSAIGLACRLAVISDPLRAAEFPGTYDDLLVPHALLNKTICGLISRPVVRRSTHRHQQFAVHHCRDYAHLDDSARYVDAISAAFRSPMSTGGRMPGAPGDGAPLDAARAAAATFTGTRIDLIKAGLAETCRALARNRATRVLVPLDAPEHAELSALAAWREVPVISFDTGPYQALATVELPWW
jgi:hypothetical protein